MQCKFAVQARSGVSMGQFSMVGGVWGVRRWRWPSVLLYHHPYTMTSQALAHLLTTPGTCYVNHGVQEVGLIDLGHREQGDALGAHRGFPPPRSEDSPFSSWNSVWVVCPNTTVGPDACRCGSVSFPGMTLHIVGT